MSALFMHLSMFCAGIAFGIGIAGHFAADPAKPVPVDYDAVSSCIFERYDTSAAYGEQLRMIRFCLKVYPTVIP